MSLKMIFLGVMTLETSFSTSLIIYFCPDMVYTIVTHYKCFLDYLYSCSTGVAITKANIVRSAYL